MSALIAVDDVQMRFSYDPLLEGAEHCVHQRLPGTDALLSRKNVNGVELRAGHGIELGEGEPDHCTVVLDDARGAAVQ